MIPRLHLVTDDAVLAGPDFAARAAAAMEAGGPRLALHVRGPHSRGQDVYRTAQTLTAAATATGSTLLVNDRADVARALGLGVHLGRRSLPAAVARPLVGDDVLVGVSIRAADPAAAADAAGADYLVLGTLYASPSHPERAGAGPETVAETARSASVPVLGIGGITPTRVDAVIRAGGHGVAVLSGVWLAPDPAAAVLSYLSALERALEPPAGAPA